jgi:hypothetical protein
LRGSVVPENGGLFRLLPLFSKLSIFTSYECHLQIS